MKAIIKHWTGWDLLCRLVRKLFMERRLKQIAAAHGTETQVMLYMWPDGEVDLHVGNPTNWVMLGEVSGENAFSGKSVDAAITSAEMYYLANAKGDLQSPAKNL